MSEREEIMELIRNEYDPAPSHYKMGEDWDDGAGRIADAILADKILAERRLREIVGWVESWVSNPAGSYSTAALDGLFGLTRDKIAALPHSSTTECPSCKLMFENGGQCAAPVMRGGCPMGGDV